jgi:hypothetical protein
MWIATRNDTFTPCDVLRPETDDDRTCYRVEGYLVPESGQSCLGGVGVVFGGGAMACSRRSDIKMPAIATAQSARDILRRVLGGRTTIAA